MLADKLSFADDTGVELTPEERYRMIAQIQQVAVQLGNHSDFPLSVGGAGDYSTSPYERIAWIERFWHRACPFFLALQRQPESVLEIQSVSVTAARSRGGAEATLQWSRSQGVTSLIQERRLQKSEAAPLQWFALDFLRKMGQEMLQLAEIAAFAEERALFNSLSQLARQIETLKQSSLQKWEIHEQASDRRVHLRPISPLSRRMIEMAREYNERLGFDWKSPDDLSLTTRPLWEIYELYCYATLVQSLLDAGGTLESGNPLSVSERGLFWKRSRGEESRLVFRLGEKRVSLLHQPLYPSQNEATSPEQIVSRSHALRPDFVLETETGLIVLDAKFRAYPIPIGGVRRECNALQDDINKMHTYRDALLRGGVPVTTGAYCLFPGTSNDPQNLIAYPSSSQKYPLGTGGVGAIRLRPGNQETETNLQLVLHA